MHPVVTRTNSAGSTPRIFPSRWLPFVWLLATLVLVGCVTRPTEFKERPPLSLTQRRSLNQQVFDRAWNLVNRHYFDPHFRGVDWAATRERYRPQAIAATDDATFYGVLNRMCGELKESHLAALSPRRAHEWTTEHRAAVGIRWLPVEGKRIVSDVVPGSPADAAGVKVGWIAVSRNGTPLREGDPFITHVGEPVTYAFLDEHDEPRTLTMIPQLLTFEREESKELSEGWQYLRFDRFSVGAISWLSRELKTHAAAPGVVVDLRQNGGGSAFALGLAIAEFFPRRVAEGKMVQRSGTTEETESMSWRSARYRGEVVLLVGRNSASAAEIFSHVLQFHHRAKIVGQPTAGAVIYARNFGLPDGGSIQIPVTDYVGLDGQRLEGRGVKPDVLIPPPTLADLRSGRDVAVERARAKIEP
jgi:C-terminal processing protease CtpA/Prc